MQEDIPADKESEMNKIGFARYFNRSRAIEKEKKKKEKKKKEEIEREKEEREKRCS